MSRFRVVIVDCASLGIIGGPFAVLVLKGGDGSPEACVSRVSGIRSIERAQAMQAELKARFVGEVAQ